MKDLERRLTDLLARKAGEVDVRPVDGFAEAPYKTALASADLDSVTETRDLATIDLEPTNATDALGRNRRRVAQVIAAAAAAVAIAFVATHDGDAVDPADEPSPTVTVTVPPAPPARALLATPGGPLEPGTYFVDEIDETPTPRIYFTIGAGWTYDSPLTVPPSSSPSISNWVSNFRHTRGGSIGFTFWLPGAVFSDACHWTDGYQSGRVDTVDGLVAALSEQRGWADVTGPSDISIDGYAGKALQRTAPNDLSDCDIMAEYHGRMATPQNGSYDYPAFQGRGEDSGYEPGSIETLWVLDIDGAVVLINTMLFPSDATMTVAAEGPSAADRAEFAAVLDSIRIDRG